MLSARLIDQFAGREWTVSASTSSSRFGIAQEIAAHPLVLEPASHNVLGHYDADSVVIGSWGTAGAVADAGDCE